MPDTQEDPVVKTSRREAAVALLLWLAAMTYTVGYCTWYGYGGKAAELKFVLGFPDWVFWGIMVPWTFFTIVSWFYAFVFMSDASLEEPAEAPVSDPEPEGPHDAG
ncbi:MAG: DUF997 family protein [Planctomycetaceae bacterium]